MQPLSTALCFQAGTPTQVQHSPVAMPTVGRNQRGASIEADTRRTFHVLVLLEPATEQEKPLQ